MQFRNNQAYSYDQSRYLAGGPFIGGLLGGLLGGGLVTGLYRPRPVYYQPRPFYPVYYPQSYYPYMQQGYNFNYSPYGPYFR